ncbi:efflux transporter outer membrane subunit [Legionella jordanis]|uniref:Outer membrane efflux protein n=1 Tax=Legionella jordanis TaxID=456 RepID=A0A0W0VDW6_9GAMM|nr:efflux transporter outer membrane subunit [Legionella jordanis]KTD18282.1 outer membrane efflux protein [Legionella jordanis]RMX05200.1 efflux transporter outer membrane subunit [Legionella jordanis]RMX20949.1 efflux transporter outer membrane subunit [Legionella jordanis]VEH13373.1 outer membrane efflux protein [Legionella jordanis]
MRHCLGIFTVSTCLLLSSCLVGPNYKEPRKLVASHWIQKSPAVKEAPVHEATWWKVFNDPTLTYLVEQAYQNNLSLQVAGIRVLQTRAQLAQSVGELYPQQQALFGNYTYQRVGGSSLQDILPSSFETAVLGVTASWELDFWGKYRRAIRSNDANFLASIAAYDNALVSLTADVASSYMNIRTYEELIRVTKANIQLQTMSLRIAKSRFKAGETSLLDVEQAQTELASTIASLPPLVASLQRYKDLLGLLLGTVPNAVDCFLIKSNGIPKAPQQVAVGIPIETLAQRPDIHQARLAAIAQSEAIGAVKANLFPSFSLSGTFAFAANTIGNNSISDIFKWSNRNIAAGPGFTWPILNYGQITNAVRVQDAVFQETVLNYVNQVLKAQQEVQDNISRYIQARKAEQALVFANNSAIKTTKLALTRYKEGQTNYTAVLNAEQQQLRIQTSLTNAKGETAKALVALYRSLGGGWQIRNGNDVVPQHIKAEMAQRTNWGSLLKQKNHEPPITKGQRLKQLYLPNW